MYLSLRQKVKVRVVPTYKLTVKGKYSSSIMLEENVRQSRTIMLLQEVKYSQTVDVIALL